MFHNGGGAHTHHGEYIGGGGTSVEETNAYVLRAIVVCTCHGSANL